MGVNSIGLELIGARYHGFCKKPYEYGCQNELNGVQVTVVVRIVPIVNGGWAVGGRLSIRYVLTITKVYVGVWSWQGIGKKC